ncbi:MAG: cyclic nucleotide-binding domain-containing protein [Deltaproteobacteria bacterium]|nr:cyclic nucleotide-binding domain-containing protein [Deltaproteobacteria bacterium]
MDECKLDRLLLFDGLTPEQIEKISPCCQERRLSRGERIFAHGDKADHLFVVLDGQVDLRLVLPAQEEDEGETITSVRENQVLGWSALTHSPVYTLSAYCASDTCRILEVDRARLFAILSHDHHMGFVIMSNVAEVIRTRFAQLQEEMARRKEADGTKR